MADFLAEIQTSKIKVNNNNLFQQLLFTIHTSIC